MKLVTNIITISAIALLTAACSAGSDSGSSGSYGSYGSAPAAKVSGNHSWKTTNTSKGNVFSDQAGKSLYTFTKDTAGVSNCYDSCAAAWPPFTAGNEAKNKGNWSVVTRKDGTKQWALNGQPLYYFAADKAAGDVRGDGLNGVWFLARPTSASKPKPATSSPSSYSDY